jgi:hypothetical protein
MVNNFILGAGIAGLVMAELKRDEGFTVLAEKVGGQMKMPFPLGPRILHQTDKTAAFLKRVGITAEPKVFKCAYIVNGEITNKVTEQQKLQYYLKTRGNNKVNATTMSEGKTSIIGWDINEINLVDVLYERNKGNIEYFKLEHVDAKNKLLNYKLKYNSLISTIPLDILTRLVNGYFGDPKLNLKKREVHFHLCELENEFDYDYLYNIDDPAITRMTKVQGNKIVVEATKQLDGYFVLKHIAAKTQLEHELKLKKYHGIELVGRYAQHDHAVKTNDIIERYYDGL